MEEFLTEEERKRLREVLKNPSELDRIIDLALKGWRRSKVWPSKTKKS